MLLALHHDFDGAQIEIARQSGATAMTQQKMSKKELRSVAQQIVAAANDGAPVPKKIENLSEENFLALRQALDQMAFEEGVKAVKKCSLEELGLV